MHVFSKHLLTYSCSNRRMWTHMQADTTDPRTPQICRAQSTLLHLYYVYYEVLIKYIILWRPNRRAFPLPFLPSFSSTFCHSYPWAVGLGFISHAHCFPESFQIWVLLSSIFLCKQLLSPGFIYCNLSCYQRLLLPNTPTHHYTHPQQKHTEKA